MRKIKRAYDYAFYTLYKFWEYVSVPSWWSDWKAGISLVTLEMWTYSSMKMYYHDLFDVPMESSDMIFVWGIIFVGLNWYLFEYQDKWRTIVKRYNKRKTTMNNRERGLVWLVILFVIVAYWYGVFKILPKLDYK